MSYSSTESSTQADTLNENTGGTVCGEQETNDEDHLFAPFNSNQDPKTYKKGTFQYLFEKSQFVQALDPIENDVKAEVIAMVEDKLYVDFGCKFHAVVPCRGPPENYHVGKKVIITVQDLEMSNHFIGDPKDKSLLEAEAKLVRSI